ncbi:hypothetical protein D9M73_292050 [compost metagenome]
MEIRVAELKVEVPTCAPPYDEHQLQVYLKKKLKFFQIKPLSLRLPLSQDHVYKQLHQSLVFLFHFVQAVDSLKELIYEHGHEKQVQVLLHHIRHEV